MGEGVGMCSMQPHMYIQGDTLHCSLGSVDMKTLRLKRNLL